MGERIRNRNETDIRNRIMIKELCDVSLRNGRDPTYKHNRNNFIYYKNLNLEFKEGQFYNSPSRIDIIKNLAETLYSQIYNYDYFRFFDIPNISTTSLYKDNSGKAKHIENTIEKINSLNRHRICDILVFNQNARLHIGDHDLQEWRLIKKLNNVYYVSFPNEERDEPGEYDDIFILYTAMYITAMKNKINCVYIESYDSYANIGHASYVLGDTDSQDAYLKAHACKIRGKTYYFGTSVYYEETAIRFKTDKPELYAKLLTLTRNTKTVIEIDDQGVEIPHRIPILNNIILTSFNDNVELKNEYPEFLDMPEE